eukprot:GSMAST32.ASY1.ANO1.1397.1 assembled CDS
MASSSSGMHYTSEKHKDASMRRKSFELSRQVPPSETLNYESLLQVSKEDTHMSDSIDNEFMDRVTLNVGGVRFETRIDTLCSVPDTLLGTMFSERNRAILKPDVNGEFFFDRDPKAFSAVLNFHRTGKIFIPPGVNADLVKEELVYFHVMDSEEQTCLYTWGIGEYGQLGHGDRRSIHSPRVVSALLFRRIKCISLGTSHSAALTFENETFTWGYGGDGRLGHGDEKDVLVLYVPKALQSLKHIQIKTVVCGELHTAALTVDGELYTWGLGKNGRLGHEIEISTTPHHKTRSMDPQLIFTDVACGGLHTAAISIDGSVWMWGLGKDGRLGHGDEANVLCPKKVQSFTEPISQVICGGHHSAALSVSGTVFTWGFDDDGRLGHGEVGHKFIPTKVENLDAMNIVMIACGCWHSAALTSEGAVYTWGSCKSGQLGQAHRNSAPIPRVVLEGIGGGVKRIACGTAHTAALTDTGELYTWGKCDHGRLGYDCKMDQTTPKLVEALKGKYVIDMQCGVYDTAALVRG